MTPEKSLLYEIHIQFNMRRNSHIVGAMMFGLVAFLLLEGIRRMAVPSPYWILSTSLGHIGHMFVILLFSALGGILPDILDPAYSSKHRRFAHNGVLGVIMIIVMGICLFFLLSDRRTEILAIYYFACGYLSHLTLDRW